MLRRLVFGLLAAGLLSLGAATAPAAVVWSAGMETGDISEWGPHSSQDSGSCSRSVTTELAHSGTHSLKLTIDTTNGKAACRQHRNKEAVSGNTYYYSAWYYYPTVFFPVKEQYNVFQFKSHGTMYPSPKPQPFWSIEATQSPLTFALNWKGGDVSDTDGIRGPYANSTVSQKEYRSTTQVPIGRWFQIEAYLVQSGQFTGTLTVWIDGTLVWDFQDVRTKWPGGDQRWSVNNYSNSLDPPVYTAFIDDAQISTTK